MAPWDSTQCLVTASPLSHGKAAPPGWLRAIRTGQEETAVNGKQRHFLTWPIIIDQNQERGTAGLTHWWSTCPAYGRPWVQSQHHRKWTSKGSWGVLSLQILMKPTILYNQQALISTSWENLLALFPMFSSLKQETFTMVKLRQRIFVCMYMTRVFKCMTIILSFISHVLTEHKW